MATRFSAFVLGVLLGSAGLLACGGGGGGGTNTPPSTNHAPVAASASLVTAADTASAPATPAVVDPDAGDAHNFEVLVQAGRGVASLASNRLVYTPDPGFAGTDAFTFRATDGGGLSVVGTADVTVTPVNHPPTATGGAFAAHQGVVGSRTPWVDDLDPSDVHTLELLTQPASGTVTLGAGETSWTFTPDAVTSALLSFSYRIFDPAGASTTGTGRVRVYDDASLAACRARGAVNGDGTVGVLGKANRCTFYSSFPTRKTATGTQITVDYFSNRPADGSAPRALVVLIGGGSLDMGLSGSNGVAWPSGGGNFVVRTAQLLADAGYLTLAVDRPSDGDGSDAYRISPRHAVDILQLARRSAPNLDLFLVGTSRGALSVVPQSRIATGISISSPVTARGTATSPYWVGAGQAEPTLRPSFVERPSQVMWHDADACTSITPASGSQALADALGASTAVLTGGFRVTQAGGGVTPDVCGAFDYHGFLGIEPEAVASTAAWLDAQVAALPVGNRRPRTTFVTVPTLAGVPRRVDLSKLVVDPDGDPLTYELAHATSALGGAVALSGSFLTYTPPALPGGVTSATDDVVWVARDGHGHVAPAVLSVKIGD